MHISQTLAFKMYKDYHCNGNQMGTSPEQMGIITSQYSDLIPQWQKQITSNDENIYDFDDSEYKRFQKDGEDMGKEATGDYEGRNGKVASGAIRGSIAAAGATFSVLGNGISSGITNVKNVVSAVTTKTGALTKSKNAGWSAYAAAGIAIATAAFYWFARPQEDGHQACLDMNNPLANTQTALQDSQNEMENMADNLVNLQDEANTENEEANAKIEEEKTQHDYYLATYQKLKAKAESGPLTDEEKDLYKSVCKYINSTGENINKIQQETSDTVGAIYSDMETYQDGYNNIAQISAETTGLTDYTSTFDKATRDMCYVEGASQTLNAASGVIAGTRLMIRGWYNWVLAIASIAAGGSSIAAATEQFKWAGEADTTYQTRLNTVDLNKETEEIYDVEIDNYDDILGITKGLEIIIPDDVKEVRDESSSLKDTGEKNDVKSKQKEGSSNSASPKKNKKV